MTRRSDNSAETTDSIRSGSMDDSEKEKRVVLNKSDEEPYPLYNPDIAEGAAYTELAGADPESGAGAVRVTSHTSQYTSQEIEKLRSSDGTFPKAAEGKILVDWDGPNDPENPRNWKVWKKIMVTIIMSMSTTSLYMGAAIISPAMAETQEAFHTSRVKSTLGLTLFVWGYGLGSLWFTPMSEIPVFRGRNPTYFGCQFIFAILQIPTGLINHVAPYAVLRFLAGVFASPPLSTTGATLADIWDMPALVVALVIWACGAIAGPFIGPLIGAALSLGNHWRYIFWFLLAASGGLLVIMVILLPETSHQELLTRKARRLRKETGKPDYISSGEILMQEQSGKELLKQIFLRPIILTFMEPVIMLMDLHLGLVYSVLYLFMEGIPIAYMELRGWNTVEMGLAFMPFLIGCGLGAVCYLTYVAMNGEKVATGFEKVFGPSAVVGACLFPAGLLIWGWLERADIHWAIGMIGNILFSFSAFLMFQSYFAMIGVMFPPATAGSAFASNNIVRSLMGGAFPLFGTVFFHHTSTERYPVGWGSTILAFISILMIPLPVFLTIKGGQMREYAQRKYGDKRMV